MSPLANPAEIAVSSAVLAVNSYNPATEANPTTATTTYADINATNLAITFVVPSTGRVLVSAQVRTSIAALTALSLCLRNEGVIVPGTKLLFGWASEAVNTCEWYLTGLTPGATITYTLAFARTSGTSTAGLRYGGTTEPVSGPALMKVVGCP